MTYSLTLKISLAVFILAAKFSVFSDSTYSPQSQSDDWVTRYESVMDGAAQEWLQKEYAKAIDGFS